jgi:hypothetical protein
MRWVGHVGHVEYRKGVCCFLVEKPKRKRPLGRPRHRCEDNIKGNLRERDHLENKGVNGRIISREI